MAELVLASTSRWRKQLLEAAGIPVRCASPGVDERAFHHADAHRLAAMLARAKADAVARREPDAWVIGADQVVTDGHSAWGKPTDVADHRARLRAMRGHRHQLVTGWCLMGPGFADEGVEVTTMHARADISDDEIDTYVATAEGSGCAGGYAADGHGIFLFERIDGDWSNVIGLPIMRLQSALRARGWRYGAAT